MLLLLRKKCLRLLMMRRNDFKKPIFCLVVWCIILLVSIDISTATWSPHQHPSNLSSISSSSSSQHYRHSSHNNNNNNNNNNNIEKSAVRRQQYIINGDRPTPRGGSTILQPPPPPPPMSQEQASYPQDYQSDFGTQQEQDGYHRDDHNYHHYNSPEHHHQDQNQEEERTSFFSPKIHLKHVAEALLRTSEWNRRLRQGLKYWGTRHLKRYNNNNNNIEYHQQQHQYQDQQQDLHKKNYPQHQHQNVPVNVHPSRTWQPPIQASSGRLLEEEELSLFHAKIPHQRRSLSSSSPLSSSSEIVNNNDYEEEEVDEDDNDEEEEEDEEEVTKKHDELYDENDIRYWGPDILPYLEYICDKLEIDKNGIEVSLAMIYMDRACSVETSRSNGVPSCPFCTPRTVHRLSLAAFIISLQAVRGQDGAGGGGGGGGGEQQLEQQYQQLQLLSVSLGIPLLQLQQMVEWMRSALGDSGLFVTMEEMISWNRSLEIIFSSSR